MSAISKLKTAGIVVASSVAAIGGFFGIKALHDHEEAQVLESDDLKLHIAENQARIRAMSSELGAANPTGNFRANLRGTGTGVDSSQPNVNQPDIAV